MRQNENARSLRNAGGKRGPMLLSPRKPKSNCAYAAPADSTSTAPMTHARNLPEKCKGYSDQREPHSMISGVDGNKRGRPSFEEVVRGQGRSHPAQPRRCPADDGECPSGVGSDVDAED